MTNLWGALIIFVLTAILAYCIWLTKTISSMQNQITELSVKVSPFWARLQAQISTDLHHPEPRYHEMDGLLEKLEDLTITQDERLQLKELLTKRSLDMDSGISDDQRQKAKLMIDVMDLVVTEKRRSDEHA